MTQPEKDKQFLAGVARLEAEGHLLKDIAKALDMAPGTLTYRLARLGYRSRLVDVRTGKSLADTVAEAASVIEKEAVAA